MITIAQVFENSPNPTYVINEHRKIVWANKAYAQLNRCSLQDVLNNHFVDVNLSAERDIEILLKGKDFEIEEFYKLEDGRGVWYKTYKTLILPDAGEKLLVSTSFEISSLKESLKKAEKSDANKSKILEELSSDIEAPINAVVGLARLLKKTKIDKEQKNYVKSILSISDYLKDVPKDIVELTRAEDGVLNKGMEVVDIADFVNTTLQSLLSKEAEYEVKIHFNQPLMKLPLLEINSHYLDLIINKLVSSSLRITKSSEIFLSFFQNERQEDKVSVQFSIGNILTDVLSDDLDEVFSIESSEICIDEKKQSKDIGINTCKRLINLLGGKVWFENRKAFGGSIEFVIPFNTSSLLSIRQNSQYLEPSSAKVISYLLVGEMEINHLFTHNKSRNWQTKIDLVKNGEQAVQFAAEKKYEVIIMSTELSGMDEFQTTSLIRNQNGWNKDIPVIVISKQDKNFDFTQYKDFGFTDYLVQPFHASDLYVCLSKYIGYLFEEQRSELNRSKEIQVKLYDFSGLGSLGEDAVFIRKMQDLFLEIVPEQLNKLAKSIELQQWQEVALIAHSLKSTYGNIRIIEAAEALKRIEENSNSKTNLHELSYYLKRIEQVTFKILKEFKQQ